MKKYKITFWITTIIIALFEGLLSLLTSHTEMAQEGIRHLGYPLYFGTLLMVFKVLGSIVLIVPSFPRKVKEWAYAGFGIDFISAFVSILAVDGFTPLALGPLVFMVILLLSYTSFNFLQKNTIR